MKESAVLFACFALKECYAKKAAILKFQKRSLAAVYEVFKGFGALCARRNLFIGGFYWGLGDFLLEQAVEFFT